MAARIALGSTAGACYSVVAERCVASARGSASNNDGATGCSFVSAAEKSAARAASSSSATARAASSSSSSSSSSLQAQLVRASWRSGQQLPSSSPWRGGGQKKRALSVRVSVDVDDSAAAAESEGSVSKTEEELIEEATADLQQNLDSRRGLEERYLVINSGSFECRSCGYVYNSAKGDPSYPIPGGIVFSDLPSDWRCPTCGAAQSYFQSKGVEVAGFVQNQNYGLGGNSMTEGQKSLLIYGSLVFFFALFLAGYLLQ